MATDGTIAIALDGNATFCIVVVYKSAVARLRRVSGSSEELTNVGRPRELPIFNFVALFVMLASVIPVWIAQCISSERPATMQRVAE
jgi:hypothetical protein